MRYLVRVRELKEKIDYFEKQLLTIDENIEKLENIKPTIIWEGNAASKFKKSYEDYILELKNMAENIVSHIELLISFYDKYDNRYKALRNKYRNTIKGGLYEQDNI